MQDTCSLRSTHPVNGSPQLRHSLRFGSLGRTYSGEPYRSYGAHHNRAKFENHDHTDLFFVQEETEICPRTLSIASRSEDCGNLGGVRTLPRKTKPNRSELVQHLSSNVGRSGLRPGVLVIRNRNGAQSQNVALWLRDCATKHRHETILNVTRQGRDDVPRIIFKDAAQVAGGVPILHASIFAPAHLLHRSIRRNP